MTHDEYLPIKRRAEVIKETKKICKSMDKQLDAMFNNELRSTSRHGYMRVRYEDIIEEPLEWALRMYQFAFGQDGLTNSTLKNVEQYISLTSSRSDVSKSSKDPNNYSLSKAKVTNDLMPHLLEVIESECSDIMRKAGYTLSFRNNATKEANLK